MKAQGHLDAVSCQDLPESPGGAVHRPHSSPAQVSRPVALGTRQCLHHRLIWERLPHSPERSLTISRAHLVRAAPATADLLLALCPGHLVYISGVGQHVVSGLISFPQ